MPPVPIYFNRDELGPAVLPFSEAGRGAPYNGPIRVEPFGPGFQVQFGPKDQFQSIEELFDQRTGTPFAASGPRTYTRRFRVIVKTTALFPNAILMGPVAICNCPGLPVPYAPYIPYRVQEWDLDALAVSISAEQELKDDSQSWIVTVQYSTEMPPGGPTYGFTQMPWFDTGNQHLPWNLPIVQEYDGETYTEYPICDLDGRPFVNAAGTPFSPPVGLLRGDRVLTITRNERFFETRAEDYVFVSNLLPFKGRDPGYCLCTPPRAVEMWLGATRFWRVTYKIIMKKKLASVAGPGGFTPGFQPVQILNAGLYQKMNLWIPPGVPVPVPNLTVPIIRFGNKVSLPVLLDEDGLEQRNTIAIPGGGGVPAGVTLKPTFIPFNGYRLVDLNQLLLTGQ